MYSGVSLPQSQTGQFTADQAVEAGMFSGNLTAVGATGVSFRVQSVGGLVNNLCLLLRGTSGREWRYGLPLPAVGESIVVFAPLASVEGWGAADSPYMGDAGKFAEDLRSVAKLGIEVLRGGR